MLQPRPPIVVILGHVDHGKTTLLDALRKSNVASREAGGITQHISSFQQVAKDQSLMTFIDTPGHSAFSAMRSRGSKLADIAILVVSAVDGVMPQTSESLEFIRASSIPFIVAITKSDLPDGNPDRVKTQLTENNIMVEDFGGQIPCVTISAKTGLGLPDLLDMLVLLAQLHPPQADPQGKLEAIVLESRLDPKKGPSAIVVVKNGTLILGQPLYQQAQIGKVKSLTNSAGQIVTAALPSTPVEILGLTTVPAAGSVISSEVINTSSPSQPLSHKTNQPSNINLIIKADVAGVLEAILSSLPPQIHVLLSSTGEVNESDVLLARTSGAQIISFNQKIPSSVAKLAQTEKITLKNYSLIYELLSDLDKLLLPAPAEIVIGRGQVLAEFKFDGARVAGCRCTEGHFSKAVDIKIMRQDNQLGLTRIKSLRVGKTEVASVKSGQEFGAIFHPSVDFKVGDIIIACSDKV